MNTSTLLLILAFLAFALAVVAGWKPRLNYRGVLIPLGLALFLLALLVVKGISIVVRGE